MKTDLDGTSSELIRAFYLPARKQLDLAPLALSLACRPNDSGRSNAFLAPVADFSVVMMLESSGLHPAAL